MILCGDFNVNFEDDKNLPLIQFFDEVIRLIMSNDQKLSTTKSKMTIDEVFTRNLHQLPIKHFCFLLQLS